MKKNFRRVNKICNTTIANNTAAAGGSALHITHTQANIKNSIIWDNQPANIVDTLSSVIISYSDVEGGWAGTCNRVQQSSQLL